MSENRHLSRRDVVRSVVALGSSCMMARADGQGGTTRVRGVVQGSILDGSTGEPTAAKIRVADPTMGREFWPERCIRSMPKPSQQGSPRYFYVRDRFQIALPPGTYRMEFVRGICHEHVIREVKVEPGSTQTLDVRIPVLRDPHASGWYSGNTHTHYNLDIEEDPDDRLRLVPPAEALDVSVISYLVRKDLQYVTNRYPIGRLPSFSKDGTIVDMGEECRNNMTEWDMGYGHVLFLNIPRLVEPVSTGLLAPGPNAPDFPTISMLCEQARKIGGTTIWCHNGKGMELPVAVASGVIDAFNVGDAQEGEYSRYYQYLNCGFRMPVSTGTDWWIYDHNRVFVRIRGRFNYDSWLEGLRAGRTFITNGPLLEFTVNARQAGEAVITDRPVRIRATAVSRLPFERLQIVQDGAVVAERTAVRGREASLETEIPVVRSGWIAARVAASAKTYAGRVVFAHTGPVYVTVENRPADRKPAARALALELAESIRYIHKNYRFASQADLALAIGRFEQGRLYYERLAAQNTA